MTIEQIKKKITKNRQKSSELHVNTSDLIKELIKIGCNHSETYEYKWEHDNGYGKQSYVKGKKCSFCGARDSWNKGIFNHIDYGEN